MGMGMGLTDEALNSQSLRYKMSYLASTIASLEARLRNAKDQMAHVKAEWIRKYGDWRIGQIVHIDKKGWHDKEPKIVRYKITSVGPSLSDTHVSTYQIWGHKINRDGTVSKTGVRLYDFDLVKAVYVELPNEIIQGGE